MPRPPKTQETPYQEFANRFQEWVLKSRLRNPRHPVLQRDIGEVLGMHQATFSRYARGKERLSPHECLILAHYLDVPVEEVLRAAKYPDLTEVVQQVEDDPTSYDADVKQKVLVVLNNIQNSPAPKAEAWRKLSWKDSPFKERAEEALASDLDAYSKAIKYYDAIWEWYQLGDAANLSRRDRATDDMLHAIS